MSTENQDRNPYTNGFEYGVRHLLSPKSGLVSDILTGPELSAEDFAELLHLGSIYVRGTRLLQDQHIDRETYIRVHTKPRRFPPNNFAWPQRIVFENADFVVVNKPAALPVHASVDNLRENLQSYLSAHCGTELLVTSRLDVPTRGLLVYAKTKSFQTEFNRRLALREVQKIYVAETEGHGLPLGEYIHFMQPSPRAPKVVSAENREGWQECRLRVLATEELPEGAGQRLTIELLTGRTHQIRAQLAALGRPIVGDIAYGAAKYFAHEEIALTATELAFLDFNFSLKEI
jgi:23S rRNA pseudouridine1911/1915/1917 synthase